MKVILTKEVEFEFNEEKYSVLPYEIFSTLVGNNVCKDSTNLPKVIVFENKGDYLMNSDRYDIDTEKSIYLTKKGQIFCFLKPEDKENSEDTDEPTNTEESKGE